MNLLFLAKVDDPDTWLTLLRQALPQDRLEVFPDVADPAAVEVALVAKPPPGELAKLPNLRLMQSLWMGVDPLLADPTLPKSVPLARMIDPYMTGAMSESVLAHVLGAHRQLGAYRRLQAEGKWAPLHQPFARERRIGILGLGELGADAAGKLKALGFDVAGWSRSRKDLPGITCFHGADGFGPFLGRTEILVCLLPLTAATRDILDARAFARLPRGATVINVARGGQVVDADLIAALDSGQIGHAVLDVFRQEPLPTDHPFWRHPGITLTPHIAAITDPRTAVPQIAENIERLRRGAPIEHLVDHALGY